MKEAYGSVSRKRWAGAAVIMFCLTLALSFVLAIPVLTCHAAKKKVKDYIAAGPESADQTEEYEKEGKMVCFR